MELRNLPNKMPKRMDKKAMHEAIKTQIKTVFDPEIPVDVWELGLIYGVEIEDNGLVKIVMTLTSPMCPVAGSMPMEVQEKVASVEGVTDVELSLVYDPMWTKDRMSEEAKLELDMF